MASENKKRKVDKKLHWGRGGGFLKESGPGIKRLSFYTSSRRKKLKKELIKEIING
jgi:hypothetical protein